MSADDPLAQLRGLHLPAEPGWWPPAIGWWALLVATLLLLIIVVRWMYQRWRANRWRKMARLELKNIKIDSIDDPQKTIAAYSILLRRVALALDSRENVAALSGNKWLEHLDAMSQSTLFTEKVGRLLLEAQYQSPVASRTNIGEPEMAELCAAVERVIKRAVQQKIKGAV